jgi:hypothetical protein
MSTALIPAGDSAVEGVVMMTRAEAEEAEQKILAGIDSLREQIAAFDDAQGWAALGWESFRAWASARIPDTNLRYLYRLRDANQVDKLLGAAIGHTPESHARQVKGVAPERVPEVFQRADQIAAEQGRDRQARDVATARQEVLGARPVGRTGDPHNPDPTMAAYGWIAEALAAHDRILQRHAGVDTVTYSIGTRGAPEPARLTWAGVLRALSEMETGNPRALRAVLANPHSDKLRREMIWNLRTDEQRAQWRPIRAACIRIHALASDANPHSDELRRLIADIPDAPLREMLMERYAPEPAMNPAPSAAYEALRLEMYQAGMAFDWHEERQAFVVWSGKSNLPHAYSYEPDWHAALSMARRLLEESYNAPKHAPAQFDIDKEELRAAAYHAAEELFDRLDPAQRRALSAVLWQMTGNNQTWRECETGSLLEAGVQTLADNLVSLVEHDDNDLLAFLMPPFEEPRADASAAPATEAAPGSLFALNDAALREVEESVELWSEPEKLEFDALRAYAASMLMLARRPTAIIEAYDHEIVCRLRTRLSDLMDATLDQNTPADVVQPWTQLADDLTRIAALLAPAADDAPATEPPAADPATVCAQTLRRIALSLDAIEAKIGAGGATEADEQALYVLLDDLEEIAEDCTDAEYEGISTRIGNALERLVEVADGR